MFFPFANCLWAYNFYLNVNKECFCYSLGLSRSIIKTVYFFITFSFFFLLFCCYSFCAPRWTETWCENIEKFIMLRNGNLFVFHFVAFIYFDFFFPCLVALQLLSVFLFGLTRCVLRKYCSVRKTVMCFHLTK